MKKILFTFLLVLTFVLASYGQLIESFDAVENDTSYNRLIEGGSSLTITNNTDKVEGVGSLNFHAKIGSIHGWGSYAQIQKVLPNGVTWDWSISDTLSLWFKILKAPANPAAVVFRIHIGDQLNSTGLKEEWIYENTTILDKETDWVKLKIPFVATNHTSPDSTGFCVFPHSWGGGNYNNEEFDVDKIVQFNIAFVTSGIAADSIEFLLDRFERLGNKGISAIVFNGMAVPTQLSQFTWGQSSLELVKGAGATAGTNALKWIQGDEWSNGWTGIGFNVSPVFNLGGAWEKDSVKFKLKCDEGVGNMRIQFESGAGKVGIVFTPIADNQWHSYALPLQSMVPQDNTTGFVSSNVSVVGLMAEASGIAGKVVYITDWWTGNPVFDVIPPNAPDGLLCVEGEYINLVTWLDVPGETGATYNVYFSLNPITAITDPLPAGVEVVKLGVPEKTNLFEHLLRAPNTNQSVSYYYAVNAVDQAGNIGDFISTSQPITNTAKGVPTLSLNAPTSTFAADGDLKEWTNITPFVLSVTDGSASVAANTFVDNDADLKVTAYLAVDQTYLYVAFDIEDDKVQVKPETGTDGIASYYSDCPDLFIGLYDWHGAPHGNYQRGAQPDYHLRFSQNRCLIDGASSDSLLLPNTTDYYWVEKFPTGYLVEARLSWQDLATKRNPGQTNFDNIFVPKEGMRIPIDFSINDNDDHKTAPDWRDGIMCYSPYNNDQSWSTTVRWLWTWIGNESFVGVDDELVKVNTYTLGQNYPNPFNPTTQIRYSIEKPGLVTLKIYDVLGRQVNELVNQVQSAGAYTINFDASNLSSGVYLYQINSGQFQSAKKMILVK